MNFDFDEVTETIEDGTKKFGKWIKDNKVFAIALILTIVFALYSFYKKNKTVSGASSDTAELTSFAYVPTGYEGYPTMSEGYAEDLYNAVDTMYSDFESIVEQIQNETDSSYENIIDSYKSYENIIDSYESDIKDLSESLSYLEEQNNKERIIAEMKENSNLWNLTSDDSQRKALHDANVILGEQLGATFDSATGTWWLGDERLYLNTFETAGYNLPTTSVNDSVSINKNPSSTSDIVNVGYDKNVNYQEEIIKAINSGASAETINTLNAQRDAKIKGENITTTVYYDKNTDYHALINKAVSLGASQSVVDNLNAQREAKIKGENLNISTPSSASKTSSSGTKSANITGSKTAKALSMVKR